MIKHIWPNNKAFAFSIVDDTDNATLPVIRPIYDILTELGIFITKTVWPLNVEAGLPYEASCTLQDDKYLKYIKVLQNEGHEIALHGVRGCSSEREIVLRGLEFFCEVIGNYPKIHINHAQNLDNLYWGKAWISKYKKLIRSYSEHGTGYGHEKSSKYYWGDIAKKHIKYVRGYIFNDSNTLINDPYTPYHDLEKYYVNNWFSSSNGDGLDRLIYLTSKERLDLLENTNGLCIVYTHFGDNFYTENGKINKSLYQNLKALSQRNVWLAPTSEILDYMLESKNNSNNLYFYQRLNLDIKHHNDIRKKI